MHKVLDFLRDPNRMVRSHTVELIGEFVNRHRSHFFMLCDSDATGSNLDGFMTFVRRMEELCGSPDITDVVSVLDILSQIKLVKFQDHNTSIEAVFSEWLEETFRKMCWVLEKIVGASHLEVAYSTPTLKVEDKWNMFKPLEQKVGHVNLV